MSECIFCKIVEGEIPSYRVYEDENFLAFLDITPSTDGHTIIIPKKHYETAYDLPEELLKEILVVSRKIALMLRKKLGSEGFNILNSNYSVAQQEVPHVHFHVIPRYSKDNFKMIFENLVKDSNLEDVYKKIK